jgi:DNA-3-methyladenine glycosylase I
MTVEPALKRCDWTGATELMQRYHDTEWGVPVHDDRKHFEFLILEGAQAGLSWETILKKREGYRSNFAEFNPDLVARFDEQRIEAILQDPGIIRNRLKVHGAVTNAQKFLEVQREHGSFDAYIWAFVGGSPIQNDLGSIREIMATSPESDALSKDLRQRGFKFVGSTIIYAHLQATGLVNDHIRECFRYQELRG